MALGEADIPYRCQLPFRQEHAHIPRGIPSQLPFLNLVFRSVLRSILASSIVFVCHATDSILSFH